MDTSYSFSLKRRLRGAVPAASVAAGLGVLLLWFGTPGTWRFWVLAALTGVMVYRVLGYLWFARNEVEIDSDGMTRSGRTVRYEGAELELRTHERAGRWVIREVVLWRPFTQKGREGVGFDDSLNRFEQAVRTLVARVPELRIKVSTVSERDVRDERREQVLAPLRPTPAERALSELGRSALGAPPHLRN